MKNADGPNAIRILKSGSGWFNQNYTHEKSI